MRDLMLEETYELQPCGPALRANDKRRARINVSGRLLTELP